MTTNPEITHLSSTLSPDVDVRGAVFDVVDNHVDVAVVVGVADLVVCDGGVFDEKYVQNK